MAEVANSTLLNTGTLNVQGACVVLVKTEWNAVIADELERACIETLKQYGVSDIKTLVVPGAVEIGFAINSYWKHASNKFSAVPDVFIALGCVIQGGTPHFDYVCKSVTESITFLNTQLPVPSIFGVLTVNSVEQAYERMGGIHGHKGTEAAITALKMINLQRSYS